MQVSKRVLVALICGGLIFGVCFSALAVEMTLAKVKLGSPAATVLKIYGNPTRVNIDMVPIEGGINPNQPTPPTSLPGGMPGALPGGLQTRPGMGPMAAAMAGYANNLNAAMQGAMGDYQGSGLPGLPGLPSPSGMPTGPMPMQDMAAGYEEQTTWTYELLDGTTLEFIISQSGRVIQITVAGEKAFAASKTTKGIKLGSLYKDVIFKYGFPEHQERAGRFLRASYADKHHVVFTFLGPGKEEVKKLVGITIALKND